MISVKEKYEKNHDKEELVGDYVSSMRRLVWEEKRLEISTPAFMLSFSIAT